MNRQLKIQGLSELSRWVCSCGRFEGANVVIFGHSHPLERQGQTLSGTQCHISEDFNPLKTKCRLLYLKTQFVPRSKHFSYRL